MKAMTFRKRVDSLLKWRLLNDIGSLKARIAKLEKRIMVLECR